MSALLEVEGLTKRFGGVTAVNACSFAVPEGSVTALVGPNGSGKTTAFNLITGYARADSGVVRFAGATVRRPDPVRLSRTGLTRTFQQARIFADLTLVENMVAALQQPWRSAFRTAVRGHEKARALELLEEFGLTRLRTTPSIALSGGERRRVEIARSLASRPSFMLLDEPFAGIDPISVVEIQRIVRQLKARGIGILITDHNVRETLGICDRAYIMSEGAVLAKGAPADVLANDQVREVYLGKEFRM